MSFAEIDFNNPPTPYGHPMRMIDRVHSLDPVAGKLVARKSISRNEPLIQGHFPTFPLLPGILQLEIVAQMSALLLNVVEGKGVARTFISESRLKHLLPVTPGDTMIVETQLITRKDPFYTFRVRGTVDSEETVKGQITLQWFDSLGANR